MVSSLGAGHGPQLTLQTFALVGTARGVVPGPVASFEVADAGGRPAHTYAVTISWGDDSTTRGTVVAVRPGGYLVEGAHVYAHPGNYTLTVHLYAATGARASTANRVTVFAAALCPKGSAAKGHNCIGDVALPSGCVLRGAKVRVSIPSATRIASVHYMIDGRRRQVAGRGPMFTAAIDTRTLTSGTHRLTAHIAFRSGRPRALVKTRKFAVCQALPTR